MHDVWALTVSLLVVFHNYEAWLKVCFFPLSNKTIDRLYGATVVMFADVTCSTVLLGQLVHPSARKISSGEVFNVELCLEEIRHVTSKNTSSALLMLW